MSGLGADMNRNQQADREDDTWLVTGAAGFIGMHTCLRLLEQGVRVVGLDNINDYYDVSLKHARLACLNQFPGFTFSRVDLSHRSEMEKLFDSVNPRRVIHLAAQAGVRHSFTHPHEYVDSNLTGFLHVLEGCRSVKVQHLIFASSSSVYGANATFPFSEMHDADHPLSLYAATKKANEVMAHSYSHLYQVPVTGLRFFTVYGPWGRPDMALFKFTKAILEGRPIEIYGYGEQSRDFTFVDDIVEGVIRISNKPAIPSNNFDPLSPSPCLSQAPYRLFNIGNGHPTPLMSYITALEEALGIEANKHFLPMQPGDVPATAASTDLLNEWIDYKPTTTVAEGVRKFVDWYRKYYGV